MFLYAGNAGSGTMTRIAGIEHRKETEHEGSGRPDRDHDLPDRTRPVAAAVVLGDRGAQGGAAQASV